MRMISVFKRMGEARVVLERWDGDKHTRKDYQPSRASLDRLAHIVNMWRAQGLLSVRPFLGGWVGYVAEEATNVPK